uniref:Type 4 fimbrial biogenesis protein PilX N-terminal domain-containing protein n=1 Tax=candidate division WOR-3 bacterium TaxID=2052148 RepID=A0A7C4U8T2_UNCW3
MKNFQKNNGIVLVTTVLVMSLVLIGVSIALFLTSKAIRITGAEYRAYTAFEASEGGMDRGYQEIHKAFLMGERINKTLSVDLGKYNVEVIVRFLATAPQPGGAIEFAVGYLGLGVAASRGGAMNVYTLTSNVSGSKGAYSSIEGVIKKVIGIAGR